MKKNRNLTLLYLHSIFFELSDSMLALALPIFIYQLYGSITAVFIFQLAWTLIDAVIFIPVFNLGMHLKNPKYFMALGVIFYVISLYFFGKTSSEDTSYMIPATIFFSLYVSFYWLIRHWFFSLNSDHEKMGKQVSSMNLIMLLMGFVGPILAGILSKFASFNITFLFGAFFAVLGIVPILFFHAPAHPRQYGFKKVLKILGKPELKLIRITHFWDGFDYNFSGIGWLLAFTIFVGSILDLGLLVGLSTLLILLANWGIGKWFDARKRKEALNKTTAFHVTTTFLLSTTFFFPSLTYAWAVGFLNQLSGVASSTVNEAYLYALSSKIHPIHFHLNREIYMTMGRIISSGGLAIAFYFLPNTYLWLAIALGSFFLLGRLLVKRVDHLLD